MKRLSHPLAVLAVVLLGLTGCGKSSTTPPQEEPDFGVFPSTPDILMQTFQFAYETMNPGELAKAMHPQSVMVLQQSTRNTFPDVGASLDRTELTRIIERMFSKQDATDPSGHPVPGVETIAFQAFQRVSAWTTSLPGDVIPDTECALYDIQVRMDRGQNYSLINVSGAIRFYVSHRDSTVAGVTRPYYQIIGQADLTDDPPVSAVAKGYESSSWGSAHVLFR